MDWKETGTAHKPGILPADVAELLDHGATTIVLSQGVLSRLRVCRDAECGLNWDSRWSDLLQAGTIG